VTVSNRTPSADAGPAPAAGGTLYVVATPIGNLGDVTLRALEVLRTVPLVAAEDTRLTRRLFERHAIAIATRLTSYHARSGAGRRGELLDHLRSGRDVALVTDAGTPAVSDPGEDLVRAWVAEGGQVVAIPGASAVLAAVVASGVAGARWSFEGFLPRGGRTRRERLARIAIDQRGTILFEAPGRVAATLDDLVAACGPDRPGAVCRELTKLHESIVRGSLVDLARSVHDGAIPPRGEFVIVVGSIEGVASTPEARAAAGLSSAAAVAAARADVDRLVAEGVARGDAARRVSASTGVPRRQIYGTGDGA
jgi:16S rRNA (cytidine1402-2'-O)-methyltransferase